MRHACILCLTLLSSSCDSGSSRSARADQPVAVPTGEEVSCRSCSLSFQRLRSFPHGDDDTLFGPHAQLMVLASGKAVVAPVMPSGGIARFDTAGQLERVVGRSGGGPGELGDVFSLAPSADSLLVAARDRVSLFSSELRPIREAPVATIYWVVRALGSGAFIGSSVAADRSPTLHILGPDLTLRRSFGVLPPGAPRERRSLAVDARTQIWASVPGRYALEHWDTTGALLKTLIRTARFFPTWTEREAFNRNPYSQPPLPRVIDLYSVGSDLWVLLEVADAHWTAQPAPAGEHNPMLSLAAAERRVDRLLEVLDTASGTARVSARLPMFAISFGAAGQLISVREDSEGIRRFDEWAVTVTQ